jgi:hypothetical protein
LRGQRQIKRQGAAAVARMRAKRPAKKKMIEAFGLKHKTFGGKPIVSNFDLTIRDRIAFVS